jgi:hypothetical protein
MTMKPPYTRLDAQKETPDILGNYHNFVMASDFVGFEKFLDTYNTITKEERAELLTLFRLDVEKSVRRNWRGPRSN